MNKIKKFILAIVTAVFSLVICFAAVACADNGGNGSGNGGGGDGGNGGSETTVTFVGNYNLYSATAVDKQSTVVEYTVGETVPAEALGNAAEMVLEADYQTLEVKEDGTFVWKTKFDMLDNPTFNGSWEVRANNEKQASFTMSSGEVYLAALNVGKLTLTYKNNGASDVTVFDKI